MNIDTATIRRLRDALVASGSFDTASEASPASDARQQAALERVAPFVEVMCLMMTIDGDIGGDERAAIIGASKMLTSGMVADDDLEKLLDRFADPLESHKVEARLQTIGNAICRDRLDRETAFTLAAAIAVADGRVAEEESLLVDSIAEWFGLSNRRCEEILSAL